MALRNIYLIEDDNIYAEYISRSLQLTTVYEITRFPSAEAALEAMTKKMPDALIVDFRLPKMNGIDFFEKIRSQVGSEMKVILISAIDDGSMVLGFIQKGVRDYVIKDDNVIESLQAILAGKDEDYFLFT